MVKFSLGFFGKLEMSGAKKMDRYLKYIDFRLPLVEIGAMQKNMFLARLAARRR